MLRRNSPIIARNPPSQVPELVFWPKKIPINGTKKIYKPVIKPAFPAVVNSIPTC